MSKSGRVAAFLDRIAKVVEGPESDSPGSGGTGTPAEGVSGGPGDPGGHWCDVADNVAARLAAAEDELERYRNAIDPWQPTAGIEALCKAAHDACERTALVSGWVTQEASRKPWAEVPDANKEAMRAAVTQILARVSAPLFGASTGAKP